MERIRDKISRKRRSLMLLMLPGIVCFAGGMILGEQTAGLFLAVGLAGFFCMFAVVLLMLFAIRCPRCGGNLGYAVAWPTTWNYSVSPEIRFCQFCGVDLDTDMKEISPNNTSEGIRRPADGSPKPSM